MLDQVEGFYSRVCQAFGTDNASVIAEKLGLTKHAVYLWRDGGMASRKNVARMAEVTGFPYNWLLTGAGEAPKNTLTAQETKNPVKLLMNTYMKPEVAEKIRSRAGDDYVEMARQIGFLTERGLDFEEFVATQSEKTKEWRSTRRPRRKRKALTDAASKKSRKNSR